MNKTWTDEDVTYLRLNAHKPDPEIAATLGKSKRAVENKRQRMGISKNGGRGAREVRMDVFKLAECRLIIQS